MNQNQDDQDDVMDAWKQSGDQDRHTAEPSEADDSRELQPAMVEAFEAVLEGDASSNWSARDENVAVLLRGLDDADELEGVIRDANAEVGRDFEGVNRGEALKALVRVGLKEVRPELMDLVLDAKEEYESSKDYEF